jgi:hypothetical protein
MPVFQRLAVPGVESGSRSSPLARSWCRAIVHFPEAAGVRTLLLGALPRSANDDELLREAEKAFDFLYDTCSGAPHR